MTFLVPLLTLDRDFEKIGILLEKQVVTLLIALTFAFSTLVQNATGWSSNQHVTKKKKKEFKSVSEKA